MYRKYNAKKVTLDGHKFDSLAEAKHYWHTLKPREAAGEIQNLELQPVFRCEINGNLICKYIADFAYFDKQVTGPHGQQGMKVVEDVKGFKTSIYRLKKKLVEALHPAVKISEVSPQQYRAARFSLPLDSEAD